MLFPVFASVREKARATACLNNCKQVGLAEMQYAQDNDETLWNKPNIASVPKPLFYSDVLMPYLNSTGVFLCPDTNGADVFDPVTYVKPTYPVTYGFGDPGPHSVYANRPTDSVLGQPFTLAQFDKPSDIVLLADASFYWSQTICEPDPKKTGGKGSAFFAQGDPGSPITGTLGQPLHQGGMNFVFADGHAKWQRVTAIPPTDPPFVLVGFYAGARASEEDCTDFGQLVY